MPHPWPASPHVVDKPLATFARRFSLWPQRGLERALVAAAAVLLVVGYLSLADSLPRPQRRPAGNIGPVIGYKKTIEYTITNSGVPVIMETVPAADGKSFLLTVEERPNKK
jgi:hypothetical protein